MFTIYFKKLQNEHVDCQCALKAAVIGTLVNLDPSVIPLCTVFIIIFINSPCDTVV